MIGMTAAALFVRVLLFFYTNGILFAQSKDVGGSRGM
jgi:hypothetical protein